MRTIGDLFTETPSVDLYHYTGLDSLISIIESQTLRASNIFYMNDYEEVNYGVNLLKSRIQYRIKQNTEIDKEVIFYKIYNWIINSFTNTYHSLFVFCLSEKGNLLSQWRGYTPHGKGISIGFDPTQIRKIVDDQGFRLAKCLYDVKEQTEAIDEIISRLAITFSQYPMQAIDTNQYHPNVLNGVIQAISIIKHPSFSEEKEWRILTDVFTTYLNDKIKYRTGKTSLIPFIDISLKESYFRYPRRATPTMFKNVVIGPTPNMGLSMDSLSKYLSNKSASNEIVNSSIPFREL
jgi:hypothetical protein